MVGRPKTDPVERAKEALAEKKPRSTQRIPNKDLLSSGSTLVNLGCSGRPFGAFGKGQAVLLVGDSSSGKTFFVMTLFAEACRNKEFNDHRLIYDGPEDGAKMDLVKFFGQKAADRIEPPTHGTSAIVEDFLYSVDDAHKAGTPFIYVIDSLDSLGSEQSDKKFEEQKKAHRKGNKTTGSMGDGKAKKYSENLRTIINKLQKSGSILIMISQTRDNIGAMPFQDTKTRAGGRAPKFYCDLELWTSVKGRITKTVNEKKHQIGILSRVQIKKNRIQGWEGSVTMPIYRVKPYGIDDVGSCVDFLVEEGHWKKGKGGGIIPTEFNNARQLNALHGRDDLINQIEEEGQQRKLQILVAQVWRATEDALALDRQPRYQ